MNKNIIPRLFSLTCAFILCNANISSRRLIINGSPTERRRYPYMVSLLNFNEVHVCGGILITPKHVLTAAHCNASIRSAQIGRYNRKDNTESYVSRKTEVDVYMNKYDWLTSENDIMIVELKESVPQEYFVPVRLVSNKEKMIAEGVVTVMGWGWTNTTTKKMSDVLLETEVDIMTNQDCLTKYPNKITERNLCAYREGTDSCKNDSGGPLILKGNDYTSDVVVGIVSWGVSCATEKPGVYTRVSKYFDWINNITEFDSYTVSPSIAPSNFPSTLPSISPTSLPSMSPSNIPSPLPSISPSNVPSPLPSISPSNVPIENPSNAPSFLPTKTSSPSPLTRNPTNLSIFLNCIIDMICDFICGDDFTNDSPSPSIVLLSVSPTLSPSKLSSQTVTSTPSPLPTTSLLNTPPPSIVLLSISPTLSPSKLSSQTVTSTPSPLPNTSLLNVPTFMDGVSFELLTPHSVMSSIHSAQPSSSMSFSPVYITQTTSLKPSYESLDNLIPPPSSFNTTATSDINDLIEEANQSIYYAFFIMVPLMIGLYALYYRRRKLSENEKHEVRNEEE